MEIQFGIPNHIQISLQWTAITLNPTPNWHTPHLFERMRKTFENSNAKLSNPLGYTITYYQPYQTFVMMCYRKGNPNSQNQQKLSKNLSCLSYLTIWNITLYKSYALYAFWASISFRHILYPHSEFSKQLLQ